MHITCRVAKVGTIVLACVPLLWATQAGGQTPPLLAGERAAVVTEIPGVIAAGAQWELIWADFETADGIVSTADGGVLFAQEQTDTIRRLDVNNKESVHLVDTHGTGAVSMDAQGRLFGVQRTCTDSAKPFYQSCQELTRVVQLAPEQRLLANTFADGRPLGRVNDVMADGKGGAYFTVGGAFHVSAQGVVSVVEDKNITSNGILLSADGKVLYVTNNNAVLAFDVMPDGKTANRRDFAQLAGDTGGDGMAIDSEGRLYVTARQGVHVLLRDGKYLGLIPTPRAPITLTFSGPDKKTLYVPMMGAVGPDGKPWVTPTGVRNVAMTIYRIPMLSQGFKGRPK
jgi:gluconolactonase